ncbi:trimethylamine methyltransferase family protein [Roseovarius pelagicus]|uniref:Methyltransferase n=1 Tax=Roseovarius pelagicus TaxID=2980108 RepID=A0ABY6DBB0_9RHOB|nr:trimethylamine methyltransferase family protein [Roseovarius pelagicus]UXX83393.1 trimethylamine methyltransferase family protein [Roseovarius pelagicus]
MTLDTSPKRRGRRAKHADADAAPTRKVDYRTLRNPFPLMSVFSEDRIEAMHNTALDVLERLGIKVLLPEARALFRAGGARVNDSTEMVHIGRDMVKAALAIAPRRIDCRAGARDRDITLELGNLIFQPGAGAPHATDLSRGRRPGDAKSYVELTQLTQHFDVLHMVPPLIEPQDIPLNLRHYFTMQTQMTQTDKLPFVYARGTPQVQQSFELLRDFRGLTDDEFHSAPHCYTIINTNSPRQIDTPMAQGLIDFARARQVSIVTPFTLMGAMGPITVAGAITLSHAEALAAITLTQLAQPGAPVCYGTFTSNVDMKSGAPAFGTPEHFQASVAAGQLARRIGLPWRGASGSAANINDAQAANETQFGSWGCLLAGATVIVHAAGWIEGGLTVSYEKLITDMEVLQMVAELCAGVSATDADIGLSALEEVQPGGHFFGAQHTLERYQSEFYEPLIGDWSNFGTWTERGAQDANARATHKWQEILAGFRPPAINPDRAAALNDAIVRGTEAGGALPES